MAVELAALVASIQLQGGAQAERELQALKVQLGLTDAEFAKLTGSTQQLTAANKVGKQEITAFQQSLKDLTQVSQAAGAGGQELGGAVQKVGQFAKLAGPEMIGFAAALIAVQVAENLLNTAISDGVKLMQDVIGTTNDLANATQKLQSVTGQTTEQASSLVEAWKVAGGTSDNLVMIMGRMDRQLRGLEAAEEGVGGKTNTLTQRLEALGISVTNANGTIRPMNDVFADVVAKLETMPAGLDRTNAAFDVFGARTGGAQAVLSTLDKLGESVPARQAEMERLGDVLSTNTKNSFVQMGLEVNKANVALDGMKIELGEALAPVLVTTAATFLGIATVLNENLIPAIEGFGKQLAVSMPVINNELIGLFEIADALVRVDAAMTGGHPQDAFSAWSDAMKDGSAIKQTIADINTEIAKANKADPTGGSTPGANPFLKVPDPKEIQKILDEFQKVSDSEQKIVQDEANAEEKIQDTLLKNVKAARDNAAAQITAANQREVDNEANFAAHIGTIRSTLYTDISEKRRKLGEEMEKFNEQELDSEKQFAQRRTDLEFSTTEAIERLNQDAARRRADYSDSVNTANRDSRERIVSLDSDYAKRISDLEQQRVDARVTADRAIEAAAKAHNDRIAEINMQIADQGEGPITVDFIRKRIQLAAQLRDEEFKRAQAIKDATASSGQTVTDKNAQINREEAAAKKAHDEAVADERDKTAQMLVELKRRNDQAAEKDAQDRQRIAEKTAYDLGKLKEEETAAHAKIERAKQDAIDLTAHEIDLAKSRADGQIAEATRVEQQRYANYIAEIGRIRTQEVTAVTAARDTATEQITSMQKTFDARWTADELAANHLKSKNAEVLGSINALKDGWKNTKDALQRYLDLVHTMQADFGKGQTDPRAGVTRPPYANMNPGVDSGDAFTGGTTVEIATVNVNADSTDKLVAEMTAIGRQYSVGFK